MTLLDTALTMQAACLSVVPVRPDGSKAPAAFWKTYQQTPPTPEQLTDWFGGSSYDGLGVITGAVSGNLEMLEVEGRAISLVEQLAVFLAEAGYADLWRRLCAGYLEESPSGGWHWLYRVDGPDGVCRPNTKLARRPSTDDELADWKALETEKVTGPGVSRVVRETRLPRIEATTHAQVPQVLIETRGEGGFTVTAPSAGRSHPSGKAWKLLAGGPTAIPVISVEERDALYIACSQLDTMPTVDAPAPTSTTRGPLSSVPGGQAAGDRPGDDYNVRASWDDILVPAGWTKGKSFGQGCWGWTRPGKHPRDGISATTGRNDGDNLFVFTSSTEFEPETPYSKFAVLTMLEHGGDYAAAAKALRSDGFGKAYEPPQLTIAGPPVEPDRVNMWEHNTVRQDSHPDRTVVDGSNVLALTPQPTQTLVMSEDGHAHQLIAAYVDLVRFCPQRGAWLAWDGSRWAWQPPGGGAVREYAKTVARAFPAGSSAEHTHKKRALSAAGISGCLKQAQTDERITVGMGDLDADPYLLNTPAGVVDLRTGQLGDPSPTSLCTKTTTVAPATEHDPIWESFLDDTFGDDHETRGYMQRLVGMTLIGQVREQLLAFLHGVGANGKSTLAETLMHALGTGETGYAIAAPAEMLMIRKHSEHPAELAQLAGARLVVCSELDDGQKFAEAKIKQLTGRDSINARFLYGQPFTFTPTHTIWLLGNHRPQARTGGLAFWRRVKLIEFGNVVPVERRDPALGDKLNAAGGTVLAWAIAGALDYLTNGIREPGSVSDAVAAYAADQDTIGRFVTEVCHRADSDVVRINSVDLRSAYETWCRDAGEEAVNPKRFGQELRDRFNVGDTKSNGRRFYTRICILETEQAPADGLSIDAPVSTVRAAPAPPAVPVTAPLPGLTP